MNKKLLLAIGILLSLSSCFQSRNEVKEVNQNTPKRVSKFSFEGHDYIEFSQFYEGGYDSESGYVHDPECLMKDIEELLKENNKDE